MHVLASVNLINSLFHVRVLFWFSISFSATTTFQRQEVQVLRNIQYIHTIFIEDLLAQQLLCFVFVGSADFDICK